MAILQLVVLPKRCCSILKRHHWRSSFGGSSGGHFLVRCACAGTTTGVWRSFDVADVSEISSPKSFICSHPKKMLTCLKYTTLIGYNFNEVLTARGRQCFYFSRNIGQLTQTNIYFYYLKEYLLDQSIKKTFSLNMKTEALVGVQQHKSPQRLES